MEEKKQDNQIIGCCGIECSVCDIYLAKDDPELMGKVAAFFKEHFNLKDIKDEDIVCFGCKGERTQHWSPDCFILKCCYDDKKLEFCFECEDFPCDELKKWANQNDEYTNALENLKKMKPNFMAK